MNKILVITAVLSLTAALCGACARPQAEPPQPNLRQLAAEMLSCPVQEIEVTDLGFDSRRVAGCGKQSVYVLISRR